MFGALRDFCWWVANGLLKLGWFLNKLEIKCQWPSYKIFKRKKRHV